MFICNILLEVTYGSNKEDFYITILNSFSVKAYRFLPNMLSMPCFFLRTKPHMPLVHHKQQKQSIKHRHCGVTAALFLTSGKAPACLISMIYKEWTLQDLLLPRKCLKSMNAHLQKQHTNLCQSYTVKTVTWYWQVKFKNKSYFTAYCYHHWGENLHFSWLHLWGYELLPHLASSEGNVHSWVTQHSTTADQVKLPASCASTIGIKETVRQTFWWQMLLLNHASSISIRTLKNIYNLYCS